MELMLPLLLLIVCWCFPCLAWVAPKSPETKTINYQYSSHLLLQNLQLPSASASASASSTSPIADIADVSSVHDTNAQCSSGMLSSHRSFRVTANRAQRLVEILFGDLAGPISVSLFKSGWPNDEDQWNEFWKLPATANRNRTLAQQLALSLEVMGPTYVKFGQALASRPDIVPRSLAVALSSLQDRMQPFEDARSILQRELPNTPDRDAILASLSDVPVAAASIGQVYSAYLSNQAKVAIKVQRPGIRDVVEEDARLFLYVATALESVKVNGQRLIQTDLIGAVDEFMSRLREELDYRIEASNIETFASLYSHRRNSSTSTSTSIQVVVPNVYPELCSNNVLVMEWIDGTKLIDLETEQSSQESLDLIRQGIECTLSQLLETGVMHADPHGGNLWKYKDPTDDELSKPRLAYVDFGLMSKVPVEVRDGLVCAVAELVFERNVTAVANMFGELALIPDSVLNDPVQMEALGKELEIALAEVLVYTNSNAQSSSTLPQLRFDKLLNVLSRLVPQFQFQLPPYFLNNARALSTLEGMAREIQPNFNVLQYLYPYALERILANPTGSPVVATTLEHLITNNGRIDNHKIQQLVKDITKLTGCSKRKLFRDVVKSSNGPRLLRRIINEPIVRVVRNNGTVRTEKRKVLTIGRLLRL